MPSFKKVLGGRDALVKELQAVDRTVAYEKVMPPKSGLAIEVRDGQHWRVTDLEGKQVVDINIHNLPNVRESLSTQYSVRRKIPINGDGSHYQPSDFMTEGDVLRSTLLRPMAIIVEETTDPKGVHDVHAPSCNRALYEAFGIDSRDGCKELLAKALEPYGVLPEDYVNTFDINGNYVHLPEEHRWDHREAISRPGDYIEFRALMNSVVGLANCPNDVLGPSSGYNCTPVKVEIFDVVPA